MEHFQDSRCLPTGFVSAAFCPMGAPLNSVSILRYHIYNPMAEILLVSILELSQCPDVSAGLPSGLFYLFKDYM